MSTASRLLAALRSALRARPRPTAPSALGRGGTSATAVLTPPRDLLLSYAPDRDGDPDAGEIVWTWVPYEENDGRGKDRPVLVIARQSPDRVYALRLTSKARTDTGGYLALGSGDWDGAGRPSWVDLQQVYSVHRAGMRREAAALDRERFALVARTLAARYGWRSAP